VWTLPVLRTLSGGDADAAALRSALDGGDIEKALRILRENGSTERALGAASEWASRAVAALNGLPAGPARDALADLAGSISVRTA
jgi:geranylgeranyl pyrophosphate synthase